MPEFSALSVDTFLSIDRFKIIRINRWIEDPNAYADPPTSNQSSTWGFELSNRPEKYFEVGTFKKLLDCINAPKHLLAAASTQPDEFARMISEGFELGRFFGEGLRNPLRLGLYPEKIRNRMGRYTKVRILGNRIRFHTWVYLALFGPQKDEPGIYAINFSVSKLAVLSKRLVMRF